MFLKARGLTVGALDLSFPPCPHLLPLCPPVPVLLCDPAATQRPLMDVFQPLTPSLVGAV